MKFYKHASVQTALIGSRGPLPRHITVTERHLASLLSTQSRHPSTCVSLTGLPREAPLKQICQLSSHFAVVSFFSHLRAILDYLYILSSRCPSRSIRFSPPQEPLAQREGGEIRQRFILRFISACRVTVNPFALIPLRKYFQPTYWNRSDHIR